MYFISDGNSMWFGETPRHCAFNWLQEQKKKDKRYAGIPIDWVVATMIQHNYICGRVDYD